MKTQTSFYQKMLFKRENEQKKYVFFKHEIRINNLTVLIGAKSYLQYLKQTGNITALGLPLTITLGLVDFSPVSKLNPVWLIVLF